MLVSVIRLSALGARAPSAALLMAPSLLLLCSCASQQNAPSASVPETSAEPSAQQKPATDAVETATDETTPTEAADSAGTLAAIEHPAGEAETTDTNKHRGSQNTDHSVIVTDKANVSQATPEAPVQPEPDQTAGPAEPPTTATSANDPCDRPERADEIMLIDDTRELLEEQTCNAALWLDGLFGKSGDAASARRTRGFLEVSNVYSQFEGFDSRARLHVEFDLPTAKNQLSAFVGRENDEDFVRGRTDTSELRSTFPTLSEQNEWLAGLGYSLPDRHNLQTSFRVGVRGLGPPMGFVQGQLRYTLYSDDDDVAYIKTTPFWNTDDGFGVTQSFDYSHVLSQHYLARWYTVGTVSQQTGGLNWRNSAILYHNLKNKRGLAYELFIRGETDEPEPLYEYGGRVLYRHPFLSDRLFAEWAAGYSFPRTDPNLPRDGSASIGVSLELPFGDPRE
ncbi:MAG: hypothetical protein JWQ90_2244 [Hydrocarboniphaga sp.]|uniref:hypothetical protein n=1 Tax=Hydrocarboniphaga sp. TaxID=2033016 RepID=UPI002626D81E|nr:hypothetical protein [Hydrocarboniphaga sp.]MDB5969794.1 hypothetical protein [Hydrocarboniphaga sp.]